ncbi:MAG: MFS transporter [Candidatus Lokiarchaeota archaeon]|nr:MFS transporter [Candidatus Lokiarchaeota archaeon]
MSDKIKGTAYYGIHFLIFLIIIELSWILGSKVSEMLLSLIESDGILFDQIQAAEQLFHYAVAATVFPWGILIDKKSEWRKYILVVSNLVWIAGSSLLYFMPTSFHLYCGIQIIWGISFGANGPIIGSYLGDLFRINKRGTLFSIFTIFVYIIKAGAIGINGILGSYLDDWKIPNFIFAIIGLISLILFLIIGKEPKLAAVEPEFKELIQEGYKYKRNITLEGLKAVIKKPTNLLFLFQGISGMIGVSIVTRYMNYWFTSTMGMQINQFVASIILGAGAAVGALIGILLVGKWIDKKFKEGNLNKSLYFSIVCLFMQVVFYFILTMVLTYPETIEPENNTIKGIFNAYPVFYAFIIVFNLCSFCGTPVGTTVGVARTHVNLPENRGTAAALYDLFDFIGSGLAIAIGQFFFSIFSGYQITIFAGSCFWIVSGILWLFIVKFIQKDYQEIRNTLSKRARNKSPSK